MVESENLLIPNIKIVCVIKILLFEPQLLLNIALTAFLVLLKSNTYISVNYYNQL